MQKPTTPTRPVQSLRAASQARAASMWSKITPRPVPIERIVASTHCTFGP
jgi:hypothetical protein